MVRGDMVSQIEDERVRFGISSDGSVHGNDGSEGLLAADVRYAARMAVQMGELAGLGNPDWLVTLGRVQLRMRVEMAASGMQVEAEMDIEPGSMRRPTASPSHAVPEVQLAHAMQWADVVLHAQWIAVISDDSRVVALFHPEGTAAPSPPIVSEIGARALAILGAIDEPYRDYGTIIDYEHGDIFAGEIGGHAVYALARRFDAEQVIDAVLGLRSRLDPSVIDRAASIWRDHHVVPVPVPDPVPPAAPEARKSTQPSHRSRRRRRRS